MSFSPGARLGPYEITAAIGAGGMGEVYRATDSHLKRSVAIKVLPASVAGDADRLARFQREAELLAALNHPNIAAIYGLEKTADLTALVMELVEGEDLSAVIARGPIAPADALPIARQIADALEAAHEQGIIHRDLKPANIKMRADGTVKVLDFGLAKAMDPASKSSAGMSMSPTVVSPTMISGAGVILGTAAYMSPEQAKGRAVDRRADVWAFGAVLYEMLSGARAFEGDDVSDSLANVLKTEPDWSRLSAAAPARVRQVIRACLQKNAKQRIGDMQDVRLALEGAFETPASGAPAEQNAQSRKSRERWAQLVAAAAIVIASGIAVLHFRETPSPQQTLRYTLNVPDRTLHSFAISPDGRHVVMATLGNEKRQLWLRPLDALDAQLMPFTEGATYPFWSPDNRYIGFFADGKLKRVAAAGGPPQTLCDAPSGRGGSWSRDDVIVFAPIAGGNTLQRVAAGGGVPADVITTKDVPRFPVFLPDGRRFLYLFREDDAQVAIYVASLDGTENRRIRVVSSPPLFAPGGRIGHILFLSQSTLMALPFDTSSAAAAGDVFPVAEGVDQSSGTVQATVSSSGVLVYARAGATALNQISWFDRTGKPLGPLGAPGAVSAPAISPDEQSVIFQRHADSSGNANPGDLWLRDLNRGTETRLTSDASSGFAAWSPKGDRIMFGSDRQGPTNLYQQAANGSGQDELLLASTVQHTPTQWSRDGRFIVYSQRDNPESLWVLPLESGAAVRKPVLFLRTKFSTAFGQLSPDSHWMAFMSEKSGRRGDVYVRPFPSGDGEWTVSIAGGRAPRWRADGKELFFVAPDGKMMAVPVNAVAGARPSFDAGVPVALFDTNMLPRTGRPVYQYDVTADGKRFLIANAVDTRDAAAPALTVVTNWQAGLNK